MSPEDLRAKMDVAVKEALELRFADAGDTDGAVGLPSGGTPQEVLDSLIRVRRRLDRVEFLLASVIRLRGMAARAAEATRAELDDQWDRKSVENRRRGGVNDFSGAKERYADVNVALFDQRREVRAAEDLKSRADEAEQIVRTAHRGLDALRYDHIAVLNGMSMLHHLER